jgi:glycerol-3-phosphate acyltransferase PlsX
LTERKAVRVAVDAMGGDHAPAELVAGAVEAAREDGAHVLLVGDESAVGAELEKYDVTGLPIKVVPSEGVIEEGEAPALALRQKPRASVIVSTGLIKKGIADASVSMGSTGATMAAATVLLGVFEGIDRPAIGGPILGVAPRTLLLDVGSNVDCRPSMLVSFGVIGSVFSKSYWGVSNPSVGLLSVGGEAGKGNKQVKETTALFDKSGLNFVGNVEAGGMAAGEVDVAVMDGFVGNVVMKLAEGLGDALSDRVSSLLRGRVSEEILEEVVRDLYEVSNVAESHGGGPLLGVKGVSIVGHGRAKADAVRRAIGTAVRLVETGFVSSMSEELDRVRERVDA